ncbi:hypothetical protein [Rufibacter soli]
MNSSENDFCTVSLDNSRQVATLVWKRDVKLHEYQEGCRQLASLFLDHNISRCLIESTYRGNLSAEAEEWLNTLYSSVTLRTNQLQVALVMSEERYQNLIYNYSLRHTQQLSLPIQFNYFTCIEDAKDWLFQEQPSQATA